MFLDETNGIITFDVSQDSLNDIKDKVSFLKSHSIFLPGITAMGSYDDSLMVTAVDDDAGPFMLEFNQYISKDEGEERFHLNRPVYELSKINKIKCDRDFAYLLGDNIHYIYRHTVLNNFLYLRDEYLFEWIDTQVNDIFNLNNLDVEDEEKNVRDEGEMIKSFILKDTSLELY